MLDTYIDPEVQRVQAMLYAKASHEPNVRFRRLHKYLNRRTWIRAAINHVMKNRGSRTAGIDGRTRKHYLEAGEYDKLVDELQSELSQGSYRPQPVRRVHIPKANGKLRPLGIPTIKDRVVQQMVRMLIEPIFEATFLPCSYGFRPNRCTWDAIAEAHHYLQPHCQYYTVIEGDIENCFGTIHHDMLLRQLKRKIQDKEILHLLWQMLKSGVMEHLSVTTTDEGTPQGGIISPLLANVYLHRLDEWFHERFHCLTNYQRRIGRQKGHMVAVRYIRYADDFVVLMRDGEHAEAMKQELAEFIRSELKMTLSEEKTLITDARKGFDFLGERILVGPKRSDPQKLLPYQIPAKKSVAAYRAKVRELTHPSLDYVHPAERLRTLNWLIGGWAEYHHWGNAKQTFSQLKDWTVRKVHRMLRRYTPAGKRTTLELHFRPVSECANLSKWRNYTHWRTPSVEVDGMRVGLLPMSLVSTGEYWRYRGSKIPSAFPLSSDEPQESRKRENAFYTDAEIIAQTSVGKASQHAKGKYNVAYWLNREIVLKRDQHTCVICGYKSKRQKGDVHDLEVDHISPKGGSQPDNLRTVCLDCHHKRTANDRAD